MFQAGTINRIPHEIEQNRAHPAPGVVEVERAALDDEEKGAGHDRASRQNAAFVKTKAAGVYIVRPAHEIFLGIVGGMVSALFESVNKKSVCDVGHLVVGHDG
jgi:hypothetical protein